jgi:hypothetical protein
MGVRTQRHTPAALVPEKRAGTNCTGEGLGSMAGLNGLGKFRPHRDSISGPYNAWHIAITTELCRTIPKRKQQSCELRDSYKILYISICKSDIDLHFDVITKSKILLF